MKCMKPGGYLGTRPGVMSPIAEGATVDVPAETAEYLMDAFPSGYWHRMATPAPRALVPAGSSFAGIHWRTLSRGIATGEYDDTLHVLQQDARDSVKRAALAREEVLTAPGV